MKALEEGKCHATAGGGMNALALTCIKIDKTLQGGTVSVSLLKVRDQARSSLKGYPDEGS